MPVLVCILIVRIVWGSLFNPGCWIPSKYVNPLARRAYCCAYCALVCVLFGPSLLCNRQANKHLRRPRQLCALRSVRMYET